MAYISISILNRLSCAKACSIDLCNNRLTKQVLMRDFTLSGRINNKNVLHKICSIEVIFITAKPFFSLTWLLFDSNVPAYYKFRSEREWNRVYPIKFEPMKLFSFMNSASFRPWKCWSIKFSSQKYKVPESVKSKFNRIWRMKRLLFTVLQCTHEFIFSSPSWQ